VEIKEIISSGLLELYTSGLATDEEAQQIQLWAAQYPEVANELYLIETSLEDYSKATAIHPDPSLKEKLFLKIQEAQITPIVSINKNSDLKNVSTPTKVYSLSSWKTAAAALILLLLSSVAMNVVLYNQNSSINNLLASTNQQFQNVEDKNKVLEQDMQVVQSKYSLPVILNGLDAAPDAAAKIFWMKNTGDVFIDPSNLPAPPSGKNYQLWAFVDGKPVDAGIIITSKKGDSYRIQKMKSFGKVEAFAVSLEEVKKIPNTSPQGPVMVMGKM
jgi:hypothetical protein